MAVNKRTVALWLERLANSVASSPVARGVEPLLLAYADAAERAGYEDDLVQRIRSLANEDHPPGAAAAKELRTIASEAQRRCSLTEPTNPEH